MKSCARHLLCVVAVCCAAPAASTAVGAPFVLEEDRRNLDAFVVACDILCDVFNHMNGQAAPPQPFLSWQEDVALTNYLVSQSSQAASTLLSGTGSATFNRDLPSDPLFPHAADNGDAASTYSVDFEVVEPTEIKLLGTLSIDYAYIGVLPQRASYELRTASDVIITALSIDRTDGDATGNHPFSYIGILPSGHYTFEATAVIGAPLDGPQYSAFQFGLRVLPEPGSAALLATGLVFGVLTTRRALG